jgi:hypothetical protein
MSMSAQNVKKGPDALGTAENGSGRAKLKNGTSHPRYRRKLVRESRHENGTRRPRPRRKTNPGAQNMKTGHDAIGTAENESGRAKHENRTQRPRHRRKCVRGRKTSKRDPTPSATLKTCPGAENLKRGPDALGTAENESRRAKHENGTRCPQYRRK